LAANVAAMCFAPMDHAKRVASSLRSTRPRAAHTARQAVIPMRHRDHGSSCCLLRSASARGYGGQGCGAHGPPLTAPHAARVPRSCFAVGYAGQVRYSRWGQRGGPLAMRFPPSVFPLWKPPFQIPPFQSGLHQRGQTAGGKRTAAFLENGAKPPRSRRFFSAPFSAAALRVATAPPPLNQPRCARPQSWGQRVGRSGNGSRGSTRCRPFVDAAKRRQVHHPRRCAAGFPMKHRDPVTRRASDPAGTAPAKPSRCLLSARRWCGQLFSFSRQSRRGGW